jgi:glycosyltransferase involved in cell wall biosynthesis
MTLTILNVPFPFVPLEGDPVGGAEQIALQLDRAVVANGYRSIVIAASGSRIAGTLWPLSRVIGPIDTLAWQRVHAELRTSIAAILASERIDLIHFHGNDFASYRPSGAPALVTLHLPISWYPQEAFRSTRPLTWFNAVSAHQARTAPEHLECLPVIENGVAVDEFPCEARKRGFALMLGRVCREKGFHNALRASVLAGTPLLLAGEIFPWIEHQRYFAEEIAPCLDERRLWIGRIGGRRKRELLAAARCVLIPSLAPETSSLVAMEALAAGTPVIASRAGALPEIVEDGKTGFVVDDVAGMAAAIHEVHRIAPDVCRAVARERFARSRMLEDYLSLYQQLAAAKVPETHREHGELSMGVAPC